MKLIDYIEVIRKRIVLIIAVPAAAAVIAAILCCFLLQSQYEASTSLYAAKVNASGQSTVLEDIYSEEIIVRDYREIANSRTVLEGAKETLLKEADKTPSLQKVLALSYEKFAKKTSFRIQNSTRVMEIRFRDPDPKVCTVVANQIADSFMEKAKKVTKMDNLQVLDTAVVPEHPVWPRKALSILIAFAVGLMISLTAAFTLDYLENERLRCK
jgi:capsular polysaccharide biosynthesis protein